MHTKRTPTISWRAYTLHQECAEEWRSKLRALIDANTIYLPLLAPVFDAIGEEFDFEQMRRAIVPLLASHVYIVQHEEVAHRSFRGHILVDGIGLGKVADGTCFYLDGTLMLEAGKVSSGLRVSVPIYEHTGMLYRDS